MHVIETEQNNNRELHQHSSSTIIAIGNIQKCARSLGGGEKTNSSLPLNHLSQWPDDDKNRPHGTEHLQKKVRCW